MPRAPSARMTFAALRHRDFRLFWTGQLISLVGTWMQSVGQSWLVLELTHSAFKLALISALQFTPSLLLSAFAGVWVDRLRRRRLICVTQTILMSCAFVLFVLTVTGAVRYWHIAVLAGLLGITQSLDMPARQAYVVEMVGKEDLMNAIALNSAMFNGARVIGPAVAGVVVGAVGSAWAFFINAVSFLAVLIALLTMRTETKPNPVKQNVLADVTEGVRYSWASPIIATSLLTMALISTFTMNPQVLVPLLTKTVLGRGARDFGFLMSASGLGAVTAALTLAHLGGAKRVAGLSMKLMFIGAVALSSMHLLMSAVQHYGAAIPLAFCFGFSQVLFSASVNTNLQTEVADGFRGRVMGLYTLVFAGASPLGALWVGASVSHFGVSRTYAISGVFGLLSILVMANVWAARKREAPTTAAT